MHGLSNPRAKRASRGGFYLNLPLLPRGPRFEGPDFVPLKYRFCFEISQRKILLFHDIFIFFGTLGPKTAKMALCLRCIFLHHFPLTISKSVLNERVRCPQMIKVCPKTCPPFQRKRRFLAIFVILEKSQKRPKIVFFF